AIMRLNCEPALPRPCRFHAARRPEFLCKRKAKQSKESKFMKDRNTIFTTILLVLACFVLSPVAQAKQPTEDRGNGNSAAENVDALNLSTTGSNNTAHGWFSLFSNTTGSSNTADGFQALLSNTTGTNNTATGVQVLASNTSGDENTGQWFWRALEKYHRLQK